jgi:hypothetical protein
MRGANAPAASQPGRYGGRWNDAGRRTPAAAQACAPESWGWTNTATDPPITPRIRAQGSRGNTEMVAPGLCRGKPRGVRNTLRDR